VFGWNWGAEQVGTGHIGTGGGAGKVSVHDLVVTKKVDKASPNLFLACAKGKHIDKAVLTIAKAGGDKQLDYYTITMENLMITSFSNQTGSTEIDEVITLKFSNVELSYQPQDSKSGAAKGGAVSSKFDITKLV